MNEPAEFGRGALAVGGVAPELYCGAALFRSPGTDSPAAERAALSVVEAFLSLREFFFSHPKARIRIEHHRSHRNDQTLAAWERVDPPSAS